MGRGGYPTGGAGPQGRLAHGGGGGHPTRGADPRGEGYPMGGLTHRRELAHSGGGGGLAGTGRGRLSPVQTRPGSALHDQL